MLALSLQHVTVVAGAQRRKAAIAAEARNQKQAVGEMLEAEVTRLEGAYDDAISRVRGEAEAQRQAVSRALGVERDKVNAAAAAEIARLEGEIGDRKATVRRNGDEKARSIEGTGDEQSRRAADGTAQRSGRAREIGQEKVAQYRGGTNGAEIAQAIRDEVANVVSGFNDTSIEVSSAVRDRAVEVGAKFRGEAEEIATEFDSPLGDARDQIAENRDKAIETLEEMAAASADSITAEESKLIDKLAADRKGVPAQLREFGPAITGSFDETAGEAMVKIDGEAGRTSEELNAFAEQIRDAGWYPPFVAEAESDIFAAIAENDSEIEDFTAKTIDKFAEAVQRARQELTPAVSALVGGVGQAATAFVDGAGRLVADVIGQMGDASRSGAASMSVVTDEVTRELDQAVSQADADWRQQLSEQQTALAGQVDAALSDEDGVLSNLTAQLDSRAREAADPGILESIFDFVVGVFEGFFLGIWDLLTGLWKAIREPLFWIVVAVVAVVLIVAVVVLVIKGAAVLAAIAAVLAFAGKVLLVIGVIAGVTAAGYYLYLAFTRPDLSWRERGRMVGRAAFELVMAFVGTGILKRLGVLGQVNRFRQFAARVGGVAVALRLINRVPSFEKLVLLLDKVADAEKLIALLDKVGDADKLIALLDRVSDVEKLLALLDKAGDAGKLLQLLDKVADADKLLDLLRRVANADRLLQLLDKVSDADKLLRLLDKVSDAEKLLRLLDKVADADKLLIALDKVPDADMLLRMLDRVSDVDKIIQLVDKTGDAAKAAQLIDRSADVDRLLKALDKIPHADDLLRILNSVNADAVAPLLAVIDKATDVSKLEDLIALIGKARNDLELLSSMFDKITNSTLLLDYFTKAGVAARRANADLLDVILTVAKNRTGDPTRVQKLLDIAAGNAAEFARMAEAVPRFKLNAPPTGPQPARLFGHTRADIEHFCGRHTYEYWEFLNPDNYNAARTTFWPDGTDARQISAYVQEALDQMAGPPPTFPAPGTPTPVTISPGVVQVGSKADPAGGGVMIGQFFPLAGETFTRATMRACKQIFFP
ncbi:MAG: hypothetical protein ACREXX_00285 [Gammaproteobacteria bacterium]